MISYSSMKPTKKILIFGVTIIFLYLFYRINFNQKNLELLINPSKITPISPIYFIKNLREGIQSKFIFGDEDLANWYFELSRKRILEARILKAYGFKSLANQQKNLAQKYQDLGWSHLQILIDVTDVNYLKEKFVKNEKDLESLD